MLRQKPTQILPEKLLKEATIHFYCLFDESRFSDICTITELKELNWLCKHMKNVSSSQPCISMNFFTEFSKVQVFPCEYHNRLLTSIFVLFNEIVFNRSNGLKKKCTTQWIRIISTYLFQNHVFTKYIYLYCPSILGKSI